MKHRVVITGLGLITPLGNDVSTTWNGLLQGRSGISVLPESFGLQDYMVKVGGYVRGEQEFLAAVLPAKFHTKTDRFIHFALIAGHQAMTDAGFSQTNPEQRDRFGVYMGVGLGGLHSISEAVVDWQKSGLKRISPFAIPKTISNLAPAWLSMQWNLQGPHTAFTNACASSADAIGMAFRLIRDGYVDYMLAGGTEGCLTPLGIAGFGNMRALSAWNGDPAQASRPFDKNRTGFVLAEGAGVLVLERMESAIKRGTHIYAEIVGYGATSDAYHVTAMHPDARGAALAMEHAMTDAGIDRTDIGYINAHGTGTPMNDALETVALKKVFGSHSDPSKQDHVLVSSTKSMTGHLLGAAGGLEAAITALTLHHQCVPPTINLSDPDPACDLDYVPHKARHASVNYALSNSFGFGGGNSVLAFKRWIK